MSRKKKTIAIDDTTDELIEEYNINASEEFRKHIKDKYHSVDMARHKKEELKERKKTLLEKKHKAEREINDIQDRIDELTENITRNEVLQEMEERGQKRVLNEKVAFIKETKRKDGSNEAEKAVKKNAEYLAEEYGYSKQELEELLATLAST